MLRYGLSVFVMCISSSSTNFFQSPRKVLEEKEEKWNCCNNLQVFWIGKQMCCIVIVIDNKKFQRLCLLLWAAYRQGHCQIQRCVFISTHCFVLTWFFIPTRGFILASWSVYLWFATFIDILYKLHRLLYRLYITYIGFR